MKTLLSIIFILFAVTAFASPFLISDPNPGATSYQLTGWTPYGLMVHGLKQHGKRTHGEMR